MFKDLRSPYVICNAAIYPGVTYFGDSFEPSHDCIYESIERDIREDDYLEYFKNIVFKQADERTWSDIERNLSLFNTLALSCGGNPRVLLRTIRDLDKLNTTSVNKIIKSFYRSEIWSEHTELGNKYKGHKQLIDWGRYFLEEYVVPAIEDYNTARKSRGKEESTIYFWIHKDAPKAVKESIRYLTYTGIIKEVDYNIRATRSELGNRYEIKYGCIIAQFSNPHNASISFFNSLSIKKFPEFGKNHPAFDNIKEISIEGNEDAYYNESLQYMLKRPIDVLDLLTSWQKARLKEANIHTIEDLHLKTEAQLISDIYNVGPVRARNMKDAATAELLEYLSG